MAWIKKEDIIGYFRLVFFVFLVIGIIIGVLVGLDFLASWGKSEVSYSGVPWRVSAMYHVCWNKSSDGFGVQICNPENLSECSFNKVVNDCYGG